MTTFSIADFNDLFVIAIGLSAAYMLIRTEQRDNAGEAAKDGKFYTILNRITDSISKWTLNTNSKILGEISKAQQIIDYYDKDESWDKSISSAITRMLEKHANAIDNRMNKVKTWNGVNLYRWGRANYFHVLTFDCFCFGIIVLIVGSFESRLGYNPVPLLHWMLFAMLFFITLSFVYEPHDSDTKPKIVMWLCPRVVLHFLILIVALIIGCLAHKTPWPNLDKNTLTLIIVAASFGGFLVYLCIIIIAGIIVSIVTFAWTLFVKVKSIRSIKRDISFINELSQFTQKHGEEGKDDTFSNFTITSKTENPTN